MTKVIIVNINSELKEKLKENIHFLEFEPTQLNQYLEEGWVIRSVEFVAPSDSLFSFSAVYVIGK
ncbi:hypothetical protein [Flavobacterium humi]|uniref:DUF4177 domain-containing protein n=1 Tax=Flavobacterium humi TaxID=2562683 RepID=A0A4Z0L7N8_9FLAO|nr:hypothetical protein [Flavobacterium humi]TGD58251.1 hypothetical protein E4635_09605 [Flavobacterium humi]